MPETDLSGRPGRLRRSWQNLWGQDLDLPLVTRCQKFLAFWELYVPPPARTGCVSAHASSKSPSPSRSRCRRRFQDQHVAALAETKWGRRDMGAAGVLLTRARKDFDFIVQAKGLHNPDLAEAILAKGRNMAERVAGMVGTS